MFLILIAVALFAALSYAVTQSGRGGGAGIDNERVSLDAAAMLQYVTLVDTAVDRMMLRGETISTLDFTSGGGRWGSGDPCTSGSGCVFSTDGGGVNFDTPPLDMILPSQTNKTFVFYNSFAVANVGTAAADIVMWFWVGQSDYAVAMCNEINEQLGLTTPAVADSNAVDSNLDAYPGEMTACQSNVPIGYLFYHVLVPR